MYVFFKVKSGVRQGYPLSLYLFITSVTSIEINLILCTPILKANLRLVSNEIKKTMFTDDATFITDGSKKIYRSSC